MQQQVQSQPGNEAPQLQQRPPSRMQQQPQQNQGDLDSGFIGSEGSRQSRLSTQTPVEQQQQQFENGGTFNNNNNEIRAKNKNLAGKKQRHPSGGKNLRRRKTPQTSTPRSKSMYDISVNDKSPVGRQVSGDSSDGGGKSSSDILKALQEEVRQLKEALQVVKIKKIE